MEKHIKENVIPHLPLACMLLASPVQAAEFSRELSADRPDATESPYTVEPGRVQIESSLWAYGRDKESGVVTESWALGETNMKYGLTDCHDLQLVIRPWIHEHTEGAGNIEGFGDIDLRLKWNLWGNDAGATAGALMPYITVPTQSAVSAGEWQGGVIFPVAVELTRSLGAGFQVELARSWHDASGELEWALAHTAVIGMDLAGNWGAYLEYLGVAGETDYEASVFAGFTWAIGDNIQWDIAAGLGLNDAAEDFSVAQGVTFRF